MSDELCAFLSQAQEKFENEIWGPPIHWDDNVSAHEMIKRLQNQSLSYVAFSEGAFSADAAKGIEFCHLLKQYELNILWAVPFKQPPTESLLKTIREAGGQKIIIAFSGKAINEVVRVARKYGFAIAFDDACLRAVEPDLNTYTVIEREHIAARLPSLHTAQFDLAVAYYQAHRWRDVMLPLGKAMTLGFPSKELCLNLLACLSAVKHYPDIAIGLLEQARYGIPHPVVEHNRLLLQLWQQSGGDVEGRRLFLDPGSGVPFGHYA